MKPDCSLALVLAASLAVALIACKPTAPPPSSNAAAMGGRPECPADSVMLVVMEEKQPPRTVFEIPAAGPITNVPEFHDCQRFVDASGHYDSLYAIFASFGLSGVARRLDSLLEKHQYPAFQGKPALPAAEIYSYGGQYKPLGIAPNFNCLYLYYRSPGRWGATMEPIGTQEQNCSAPVRWDQLKGKQLEVHEVHAAALGQDDDYPAVARWDWDSKAHKQYVGIKCGAAWCEVGDTGFTGSPALMVGPHLYKVPGLPPTPAEIHRVFAIKGWYDEQALAIPAATGAGLQPSKVRASIIPNPVLGRADHDAPSYFDALAPNAWPGITGKDRYWRHVATARLTAAYPNKFGFQKGDNAIFLCHGRPSECEVEGPTPSCPPSADGLWWARIDHPHGKPTYRCVIYRPHPGIHVPGATRWRWVAKDETSWVRCTNGCCQVTQ